MVAPMPQFNRPTQSFNPVSMAQMLRNRMGGMNKPQMPEMGNKNMANVFGTGINPNQQPFNVGLNPMAARGFGINANSMPSSYADFLNSLNRG